MVHTVMSVLSQFFVITAFITFIALFLSALTGKCSFKVLMQGMSSVIFQLLLCGIFAQF